MKKVKILKKPRKSKIDKCLLKSIEDNKNKKLTTVNKNTQNYLNFYDDIKTPNQIYDW